MSLPRLIATLRVSAAAAVLLALAASGCALSHRTPIARGMMYDADNVPSEYVPLGFIHVERWRVQFFYRSAEAEFRKAVLTDLDREAKRRGADAVINVHTKVETHTPIPFFFAIWIGRVEYHVSGMAVQYKRTPRTFDPF